MIVGTRLPNGELAHFDVDTNDYKVARNEIMKELATKDLLAFHTPVLALISDCGKNIGKVMAHRVDFPPDAS